MTASRISPVHDLQMAVDGEAARSISLLVRRRWCTATGKRVSLANPDRDPWPADLTPALCDIRVGIARTRPAYGDDAGVREVEALNVDALRSARETIYLETQYLTAQSVGDVLAARLEEPDGPEVIVVVTKQSDGLVEQFAMGSNRDRLFRRLKAADRHGRFRAYYAVVPKPDGGEQPVGIHSKPMIVDDRFVRIGSSNFNNRSMGVDTECDLALEAEQRRRPGGDPLAAQPPAGRASRHGRARRELQRWREAVRSSRRSTCSTAARAAFVRAASTSATAPTSRSPAPPSSTRSNRSI